MSDRILGAVCVMVAASMAWAASGYTPPYAYEPVGPKAFPLLLAALLGVGGLWLAIKPQLTAQHLAGTPWKSIGLSATAVLVYALLFEMLGFTVATTLMAVPVGMAFGGTWKQALLGGLGLGMVLYVLFDKLLDVVLPTGILSWLLGGR